MSTHGCSSILRCDLCKFVCLQIRLDLPSMKLQFPLDRPPVHPAVHPVQEAIGSFTTYGQVRNGPQQLVTHNLLLAVWVTPFGCVH